ncbi:MAG: MoxR family ATPase [Candidatus Gracilibacteria bacterium]|nr:MoxR family ATPase [Candidatus Gracilibacteria bacterium]
MTQEQLQEEVIASQEKINLVIAEIHKKVIGQDNLIKSLLIGLLTKGHILLEGVPGLAKTLTVDSLSKTLDLGFNRIQFTPDLLPSDLVGTEIFNTKTGEFSIKLGPVFNNFILADEINRAPSKVQSALLEAMAEKQITIGNNTYKIEEPFIVLATQNPVEQSGTYKLPEAQLDRFLLKTKVYYPSKEEEIEMYKKISLNNFKKINKVLNKKDILEIQKIVGQIFVSDSIYKYVFDIIDASRNPKNYNLEELKDLILYGISPRGGLALISSAKVIAILSGRTFVIPEDIKEIAKQSLSHRIVLSYEAISKDLTTDDIVEKIIDSVEVV